ncbi:histidine phosphatase family protein [Anaerococcus sp. AGMB00486]|uniref:phosphoglycerate mutase (2,3-diphosphoglycerate-dependent) n=2 Tax=Anaerococcus TaxID=165779 RepID=A0ABX2N772_9FIRM|nr:MULTISPECIES: histidine phosphatase family protein [Anaerococcus]MSS76974.1 histidine phosphatase family protein [Anaerococcus porci]NVF10539.1 histidine phosphatase family protein [Anaerococcus faecalis]
MKIIFLRHGLTESNKSKRFSTADTKISKDAYKDLDKSKFNLRDYNVDKVYTSKLLRSKETAEYLGFNEYTEDKRLNEMDFGDFKGKRISDTLIEYENFYKERKLNPYDIRYPGGESVKDLIKRLDDFIEDKKTSHNTILCVSHGIAIRAAIFTILNDLSNFENFWIDNGSLTIINIENNKKILECVNKI